jgi:signal transduction histidine kinase
VILPSFHISSLSAYGATSPIIALSVLGIAITRDDFFDIKISSRWSTIIGLWIIMLLIPMTVLFFLPDTQTEYFSVTKDSVLFGISLWLIILYMICKRIENNNLRIGARRYLPESAKSEYPSIRRSAQLRYLIEAAVHDLTSKLNLSLLELKRPRKSSTLNVISELRMGLVQLKGISSLLACDDFKPNIQLCDTSSLVTEILNQKISYLENNKIKVWVSNLPIIKADADALKHILYNIIDNALKYVGDKDPARVCIYSKSSVSEVQIFIEDNGIGIPTKELSYVERPLHRGSRQSVAGRYVEGTGVGLAIAYRLLAAMHGHLSISSEVGQGTTVSIILPQRDHESRNKLGNEGQS